MFRRPIHRLTLSALAFVFLAFSPSLAHAQDSQHGRKYKPPPPIAHIEVQVVRIEDGKPVDNAAIIFHPLEGEHDKGAVELKSNDEGKALVEVLALGDKVDLQVIANGFQTYGGECVISKPNMIFRVRLNRPGHQYSIYTDHSHDTSDNGEGNCGEIVVNPPPAPSGQAPPQ